MRCFRPCGARTAPVQKSYGRGTRIWNKRAGSLGTLSFYWNHRLIVMPAGIPNVNCCNTLEREYTMKLQLAIDLVSTPDALALLHKVAPYVDVIELGTPL